MCNGQLSELRVFSYRNLRSEHYLMFLDQKIDEKMYFFEVAIKNSNPDWVRLPVLPKKAENPTSGSAS